MRFGLSRWLRLVLVLFALGAAGAPAAARAAYAESAAVTVRLAGAPAVAEGRAARPARVAPASFTFAARPADGRAAARFYLLHQALLL
jgi:hypothetical protein